MNEAARHEKKAFLLTFRLESRIIIYFVRVFCKGENQWIRNHHALTAPYGEP